MQKNLITEKVFRSFYGDFCQKGLFLFKQIICEKEITDIKIADRIVVQKCYEQLQEIPIRTLIYDMHLCEDHKMLQGENGSQKYDDYNNRFLGEATYRASLLEKYPELFRLMALKTEQTISQLCEIVGSLQKDYKEIVEKLCEEKPFHSVTDIQLGLSDSHHSGKTVAQVVLDNGYMLIYKPHSIRKEILYEQIISLISEKCGMKSLSRKFCDRQDYGWENLLTARSCQNQKEIQNFFVRYGFHIFICWFLGGSDIHGENVLAVGEFPVVLDVETIPSIYDDLCGEQEITQIVRNSVLRTGILPISVFGKAGATCFSALHRSGQQKIGLKLPYIANEETIDMRIAYKEAVCEIKESLPYLGETEVEPVCHIQDICNGFVRAYEAVLMDKEDFAESMGELFCHSARVLKRNTQQYKMLLSLSLHPDFMADSGKRKEFLQRMKEWDKEGGSKKRDDKEEKEFLRIQEEEIDSLYNLDIPLFEREGKPSTGSAKEFIKKTINRKMDWLMVDSQKEIRRQLWFIRASLMTLAEPGLVIPREAAKEISDFKSNDQLVKRIADEVCDSVIIGETGEIFWIGLWREDEGRWRYHGSDRYFYSGLSGIAVFMAKIAETYAEGKYKKLYQAIVEKILEYIQRGKDLGEGVISRKTGALEGEGSLILSLILQYRITGKKVLLEAAMNHAAFLEHVWRTDTNFDFLSGNAGFIYVLIQLYDCTWDRKFLLMAIQIGEWLWKRRTDTPYGCGWTIEQDRLPLTGMAHGNSGFLLSYALLLKHTHNRKYGDRIRQLLNYEAHFYSEKISNWIDLRGYTSEEPMPEEGRCGWCHGAPGILLSRLSLLEVREFQDNTDVKWDIDRAIAKMMETEHTGGMCLCHGRCGNLLIMKQYVQKFPDDRKAARKLLSEKKELMELIRREQGYRAEERYQMGFMNGMAGIGMTLLVMDCL